MTDKHIPASKLLALIKDSCEAGAVTGTAYVVLEQDLQSLIDEAPEVESVEYNKTELNAFVSDLYDKKMQEGSHGHYETLFSVVHAAIKRVISPPPSPDLTKLVGELVEALDDANKKIRKAKDFEYESQEHISESAYELNGFLGSTAADISVNWQKTIDSNNEILTRAKEYLK